MGFGIELTDEHRIFMVALKILTRLKWAAVALAFRAEFPPSRPVEGDCRSQWNRNLQNSGWSATLSAGQRLANAQDHANVQRWLRTHGAGRLTTAGQTYISAGPTAAAGHLGPAPTTITTTTTTAASVPPPLFAAPVPPPAPPQPVFLPPVPVPAPAPMPLPASAPSLAPPNPVAQRSEDDEESVGWIPQSPSYQPPETEEGRRFREWLTCDLWKRYHTYPPLP